MSAAKVQYKKPPTTFGNVKEIRKSLGQEQRTKRKKRRTQNFEENRKNLPCSTVSQDDKRTKLLNWKTEQKKKREAQKFQKKPPFIVGIVHHNLYFPVCSTTSTSVELTKEKKKTIVQVQQNSNIKKGITKATEKRLLAKATNAETKRKTIVTLVKKTPTKPSSNDKVESNINRRESFAPFDHKFNPPAGLLKIPSIKEEVITLKISGEQETSDSSRRKQTDLKVKLISNNSNIKTSLESFSYTVKEKENCSMDVISFSKCVNNIDDNVKKNKHDNFDFCEVSNSSNLTDKLATKSATMETPNMPMEKKYTVEYFKRVLNEEKKKLETLCEEWTEIQLRDDIMEDVRYQINQAVGQTTMLIEKKCKLFHDLILTCEKNDGDVLVTCMDLHGFWDMMYIEVKDCHSRFAKLKKVRYWQEDQSPFTISKKTITKKKVVSTRKSSRQALTLSDKKKKMTETQDNVENSQEIINMNNKKCITPCIINKRVSVFRRGSNLSYDKRFLEVPRNCMYTSTPISANVALNNSKQFITPLIAMKVSKMYTSTPYITREQTPRKSLTEKSERSSETTKMKLSMKFDENLEISHNSGASSSHTKSKSDFGSDGSVRTSDFGSDGSVRTVIEKTIRRENSTFTLTSYSTNSIKTPTESKRSIKEPPLNKSLKIRSFERSPNPLTINKIVRSSFEISTMVNISPIPRNTSVNNIKTSSKITSNTDRVLKKSIP